MQEVYLQEINPSGSFLQEVQLSDTYLQDLPKQQVWDEADRPSERLHGAPQGIYVPMMPDGEQQRIWSDGSDYYGEWHDGQPNGRGIFVSQSGLSV